MGEAAVLDIGDHLLDDSVPAVITLGIPQGERGVGERGVVAPGIEERALPGGNGTGAQALEAARDQSGGDLLFLRLGSESGVADLGCLGVGDPALALLVPDRLGILIGVQASSSMRAMVALTEAFIRMVMEKRAPRARQALMTSAPAATPPTSDISFAAGKVPVPSFEAGSRTCSSASLGRPHRSASRTTGSSLGPTGR
ncbi:hypothetical protein [Streptomyces sp. NPDC059092]|uniref:hypothetical protein n=1 Tax=Streptomyces sp. NPDC059092 TaxID=3346725 RepID=UPI003684A6CE